MRKLIKILTLSVLAGLVFIRCSDNRTGPDPESGGGNEEKFSSSTFGVIESKFSTGPPALSLEAIFYHPY